MTKPRLLETNSFLNFLAVSDASPSFSGMFQSPRAGRSRETSSNASPARKSARPPSSSPSVAETPASMSASRRETVLPSGVVTVSLLNESSASRICGSFSAASFSAPESQAGSASTESFSLSTEKRSSAESFAVFALSKFDASEASSPRCALTNASIFSLGTAWRKRSRWSTALPQKTSISRRALISGKAAFVSATIFASDA